MAAVLFSLPSPRKDNIYSEKEKEYPKRHRRINMSTEGEKKASKENGKVGCT
jgi:hypothetical protein